MHLFVLGDMSLFLFIVVVFASAFLFFSRITQYNADAHNTHACSTL
jgi:hypothetical protein